MIKFFRHIRRNLMVTGKTSKYFKYAIGEIILVVIGILIALQINNWNESKKDRTYEIKMLKEVVNAVNEDEKHFEFMIKRIKNLEETVGYFMLLSKNNIAYNDSLFPKIFRLNSGVSFQINSGPYQAIKSSGMNKISNDSIRNILINFYDFKRPLYLSNFDHINRNHQNNIEDLLKLLGERSIKGNAGNNFISYNAIPNDLFQKQEFLQILSNIKWRNDNSNRLFLKALDQLKLLKQQTSLELTND